MPFDSLTFAAATHELQQAVGTKVVKIQQPDRFNIILKLYKPGFTEKLLLCAHPQHARFHFTDDDRINPSQAPAFCMILRKHLGDGHLTAVRQLGIDRILHLEFAITDETGLPARRVLNLEVMGKHSNTILVDPASGLILDGLRRYSHLLSRHRQVLPGQAYIPPPAAAGSLPWPDVTSAAQLSELFCAGELTDTIPYALRHNLSGLSPFLAEEITARAGLDKQTTVEILGAYEYDKLYQAIANLSEIINTNSWQPQLLAAGGRLYDFSPLTLYGTSKEEQIPTASLFKALDTFYHFKDEENRFNSLKDSLQKIIHTRLDKINKKISLQEQELAEAEASDIYRIYGDLLTANLFQLTKGLAEITLPNFYDNNEAITIPLLPNLSPKENVTRYYNRYQKTKSAKSIVRTNLTQNYEELAYWQSVFLSIQEATSLADLEEIRQELAEDGCIKPVKTHKGQTTSEPAPPYMYKTSDGHTVLAGRNNRQNDVLTLKQAGRDDIWLHTQKIPGSHVIIRRQKSHPITSKAIMEAARIAAYHSQARHSTQVPVDYTTVSQVKKPKGAKAGMVIYYQQKTLYVTPALPASDK